MRITPTTASAAPGGPPPRFRIETDGQPFFSVQVATDRYLFNAAAASRRSRRNWFESWYGDDLEAALPRAAPREVHGAPLEAPAGRAVYALAPVAWRRLALLPKPSRPPAPLFYRLLTFADHRRGQAHASFADVDWERAPTFSVALLPVQHDDMPAELLLAGAGAGR